MLRTSTHSFLIFLTLATSAACSGKALQYHRTNHSALYFTAQEAFSNRFDSIHAISKSDRVSIVNLHDSQSEDHRRTSVVEDALVEAFNNLNITVVERDGDALRALVQEGSGEQIRFQVTSRSADESDPYVLDAQVDTGGGPTRFLVNGTSLIHVPADTALLDVGPEGGDDVYQRTKPTVTNDLVTATKVVGYRVLDVGVREKVLLQKKLISRLSTFVVHLRIVDSRYGTVLWTGTVEHSVLEELPLSALSAIHNKPQRTRGERKSKGKKNAAGPANLRKSKPESSRLQGGDTK